MRDIYANAHVLDDEGIYGSATTMKPLKNICELYFKYEIFAYKDTPSKNKGKNNQIPIHTCGNSYENRSIDANWTNYRAVYKNICI